MSQPPANQLAAPWSGAMQALPANASQVGMSPPTAANPAAVGGASTLPPANKPITPAAPAGGPPAPGGAPRIPGASTQAAAGTAAPPVVQPPIINADCNPADKKPDPTRVPNTELQGYQGLAKEPTTGPNKPIIETDMGLPEWTIYFMNINNVPLFNANMDTGHGGTWQFRNGGEYGRVGLG